MADGGSNLKNPSRRRLRISPQQDAEMHIRLKSDKEGLKEAFVNSFKGQSLSALYFFIHVLILLKHELQC